jgi:hypothetical protein
MKLFKLLLVFILTTQFAFADLCHFVFDPTPVKQISQDIRLIGKLNRLDNITNFTRKLRVGKGGESKVLRMEKIRSEFKIIEGQLFKGEIDMAIRNYRVLFRNVERYALEAENYAKIIKAVNKGVRVNVRDYEKFLFDEGIPKYLITQHIDELNRVGPQKYVQNLHKGLRKSHRKLGNGFDKYNYVRSSLDDLAKNADCTPLCKQSLKNLNEEIGITSAAERHLHASIIQNRKVIHLKTIKKIFNSHPEAVVIARRKEFISEAVGLLQKTFNNTKLMRRLYYTLGDSAAGKNLKLVRMFKRAFDKRAHTVHKGIIDKVSHSNKTAKAKIDLLKTETKELDFNAAMVDFSRSPNTAARETWKQMKEYAAKSEKNATLLKEMNAAEELGKKIGKTSKRLPKDISTLVSTLVIGGAFVGYFAFSTEEEQVNADDRNAIPVSPDAPGGGVIILDEDDIDNIQDEDDIIILKYNSDLDTNLREELMDLVESHGQNTENLSPQD